MKGEFLRDARDDLRYAVRLFARQPAILLVTIGGLSLGLAIATAANECRDAQRRRAPRRRRRLPHVPRERRARGLSRYRCGIQAGDVVTSIDGTAANDLTLASINEMLEKPIAREILVRRADQTIRVTLTLKPLI